MGWVVREGVGAGERKDPNIVNKKKKKTEKTAHRLGKKSLPAIHLTRD
jgi:hypothetical protein